MVRYANQFSQLIAVANRMSPLSVRERRQPLAVKEVSIALTRSRFRPDYLRLEQQIPL